MKQTVKYGYDTDYKRGYYIPVDAPNIQARRYYVWETYDGWQLYRFTYENGVARNTPLLDAGVKKAELRKAAEGLRGKK